jgi:nucleotide-binding universal stress UspA family protein
MYRSILVPLDGSTFGEHALPYALSLAERAGAPVHLAHVHTPGPTLATANEAELRAAERMYLEGLVQRIEARWSVPITTMLLEGPIVSALDRYAAAINADLIVMTTHGRGALSRFWLGQVADTLIRHVAVPVLLVRPREQLVDIEHRPAVKHILIPLDGSPLAELMQTHAAALGGLMHAQYTLLQAIEPLALGYGAELYAAGVDDQTIELLRARAQSYLEDIAGRMRAEGLRVEAVTVIDLAASAILDYAQQHAVDLIALETHGRAGLARWIIGGVADKVIRAATVPVLLHRPQGGGEWAH